MKCRPVSDPLGVSHGRTGGGSVVPAGKKGSNIEARMRGGAIADELDPLGGEGMCLHSVKIGAQETFLGPGGDVVGSGGKSESV